MTRPGERSEPIRALSLIQMPEARALREMSVDGRLLFGTRVVRMFAYGLLSVVLALYLAAIGLTEQEIGLLLTLTLAGDAAISLWLTSMADRLGRRRTLMVGAALMVGAGIVFAFTRQPLVLALAAVLGTISPSGSEVGPCQAIEQAILPQTAPDARRTQVFAWYYLVGALATATGALAGGGLAALTRLAGWPALDGYRLLLVSYALLGGLLGWLFARLSAAAEVPRAAAADGMAQPRLGGWLGLHRSRPVVLRLAGLFMLDSFAGGLVVQTLMAYWFVVRFGIDPSVLGGIFFGTNLLGGLSSLAAARVAARIGLVNTMVWTHVPSNVLLMLVPLMPSLPLAVAMLLARSSLSQMDVPTRQSFLMAVVAPDERSAAAGLTGIARTLASGFAPLGTGLLLQAGWLSLPFLLSGGLKLVYDLALWRAFRALKPPEER